jgi:prephenate dehydratase
MEKRVAIQGIKGSFHHIVSKYYFENQVEVVPYLSFDEVVNSLKDSTTDTAIMALENSIAGSIIPNYARIDSNGLHIIGEYFLDIQHHLMGLKGQSLNAIKEVYSHPMALLQCKKFFETYPHIKLIEDKDTAEVAQRISEHQLSGVAAIASREAAAIFNLEIFAESIQTIKHNETRFVVLQNQNQKYHKSHINKASLKFLLDHKRGSLATVLNVMSDCQLNLTKIQSLPKIDMPWKYAFFVDVTFDTYENYKKAKSLIEIMAEEFKVLGEYKNAKL